jgi:hypothetical protein
MSWTTDADRVPFDPVGIQVAIAISTIRANRMV